MSTITDQPAPSVQAQDTSFADYPILPEIIEALADVGITRPFPIQAMTLPVALSGHDIIGQAKTGTGKTLGFGIPLLNRVIAPDEEGFDALQAPGKPQALVVLPTRELAAQVAGDLATASKKRSVRVLQIYGGRAYEPQIAALQRGIEVVVGTPGRMIDLINQGHLDLTHVKTVVLDEADEMLDLGFLPDVERLLSRTPATRHTMLFSATMPGAVVAMARRYMTQPTHIRAAEPDDTGKTVAAIKQVVFRAHALDKIEVLARLLKAEGRGMTIVFTRTKRTTAKVADELTARGFAAAAIHGDLGQGAREQALRAFRSGKVDVLVATDVAARGIDVDDVTHVINYQCPEDEKIYLHRTGRTGRAGNTGTAVTFVDWDDLPRWGLIDKGHRGPGVPGAAGPTGAVQVDLLVLGALVVDHVRDVVDVDAAGGDIGRDQHVHLARTERAERLLAGTLAQVAVDGGGREAAGGELVGDLRRRPLGPGEHDGQASALGLEQPGQHLDLVQRVRAENDLLDRRDRLAGVVRLGSADVRRLGHVPPSHRDDGARHGGGEEHRVAGGRGAGEEPLDVRQEAQVEHLVGLVEDDRLDVRQVEVTLVDQIDHPSGRADDDLDTPLQRGDLRLVCATAVDLQDAHRALLRSGREVTGHLGGELAGRQNDQGLRLPWCLESVEARLVGRDHAVQQRNAEAEGLAGAGLGLTDDVVAGQGDRQCHCLDRERAGDADVGQRLDDLGEDRVVGERSVLRLHTRGRLICDGAHGVTPHVVSWWPHARPRTGVLGGQGRAADSAADREGTWPDRAGVGLQGRGWSRRPGNR